MDGYITPSDLSIFFENYTVIMSSPDNVITGGKPTLLKGKLLFLRDLALKSPQSIFKLSQEVHSANLKSSRDNDRDEYLEALKLLDQQTDENENEVVTNLGLIDTETEITPTEEELNLL